MSEKDNGGQAFPHCPVAGLRDYFAAKAMQGYLAAHAGSDVDMPPPGKAANRAYEYADAMLKAREL